MFSEYVFHFGLIIFPLLFYQLWTFRKTFSRLPYATPIIGLYGGLCAILSEIYPVHVAGLPDDLKLIPLILAFLYGGRYAGMISLGISMLFRLHAGHFGAWLAVASMAVYSVPPFLLSKNFDENTPSKRITVSTGLGLIATAVQAVFCYLYFVFKFPGDAWASLHPYLHALVPGAIVQTLLMIPAAILLDNLLETGRIRLQILDNQRSLQESEERYKSLVDYNPDAICGLDTNGYIVFANQAYEQLSRYSASELIGAHRLKLWFPEDIDLAESILERVLRGEVLSNIETNIRNKAGERVPVRLTLMPIVVSGCITGCCCILTDLRSIRIAEEMIRKTDKLATVGQLAAGIAHEIRNPLTSLKGFLRLLKSDDPNTERYISVMEQELDRLNFVSGQMLVLAKPQVENRQSTDVCTMLRDVIDIIQSQALLANVNLEYSIPAMPISLLIDENQIKQVFINVLKNAVEATPSGGHINVKLGQTASDIVLTIEDTGVGMPNHVLQRLGEPFYTTKGTGTGLGLMVSHRIIENHEGRILYESQENQGTKVTIALPLSEPTLPQDGTKQVSVTAEVTP